MTKLTVDTAIYWVNTITPPTLEGWYRVKAGKSIKVRAYALGHWWIPTKGRWEIADGSYSHYEPFPVRFLEHNDSSLTVKEEAAEANFVANFRDLNDLRP